MELSPLVTAGLGIIILVAGPIWLVSSARDRRRQKKAVQEFDHSAQVQLWLDAIGPLTEEETSVLLKLALLEMSIRGDASWNDVAPMVAYARRLVR